MLPKAGTTNLELMINQGSWLIYLSVRKQCNDANYTEDVAYLARED